MSRTFASSSKSSKSSLLASLPGASLSAPLALPTTTATTLTYNNTLSTKDYDVFTYSASSLSKIKGRFLKETKQNATCSSYWRHFPDDYLKTILNCFENKSLKKTKGKEPIAKKEIAKSTCETLTEWFAEPSKMKIILTCMDSIFIDKLGKYPSLFSKNFTRYQNDWYEILASNSCSNKIKEKSSNWIIQPTWNEVTLIREKEKYANSFEQYVVFIEFSNIKLTPDEWRNIEAEINSKTFENILYALDTHANKKIKEDTTISILAIRYVKLQRPSKLAIVKYEIIYTRDFIVFEEGVTEKSYETLYSPTKKYAQKRLDPSLYSNLFRNFTDDIQTNREIYKALAKKIYYVPDVRNCLIFPAYTQKQDWPKNIIRTHQELENFYFRIQKSKSPTYETVCPFVLQFKPS